MSEKKYTGAPFGTQTARFDVTGVHPKTKVPGSFTQIPYDKNSMIELDQPNKLLDGNILKKHGSTLKPVDLAKLEKFDTCLKNIRKSLKEASVINQNLKHLTSTPSKTQLSATSISEGYNTTLKFNQESWKSKTILKQKCVPKRKSNSNVMKNISNKISYKMITESMPKSEITNTISKIGLVKAERKSEIENYFDLQHQNDGNKPKKKMTSDKFFSKDKQKLMEKEFNKNDSSSNQVSRPPEGENYSNIVNKTNSSSMDGSVDNNKEPNENATKKNMNSRDTEVENPSDQSKDEKYPVILFHSNSNAPEETPMVLIDKEESKSEHISSEELPVKLLGNESHFEKASTNTLLTEIPYDNVSRISSITLRSAKELYKFQEAGGSSQTSKSKLVRNKSNSGENSGVQSDTQSSSNIQEPVSETNEEQKTESDIQILSDNDKQVKDNSSEQQINESSSQIKSSILRQNNTKKVITKKTSEEKVKPETCDEFLKRKLGPGTYNTMMGGFSPTNVDVKASGPGWARQLEVERLAALPHLLHKEQWEENKMLKRKLGPGSYEIKDFIQLGNLKPCSERGICKKLAPRFEKGFQSLTPGPGTYGIGGVPKRAIEEKSRASASTKGMLDAGDRKRNLPSVGSKLGPGTYKHKSCTDEMINKVTSLKGPYELYSGDRNQPITEGYFAAPKHADLGPGQYTIGSFVDEWKGQHKGLHGKFGKIAQYPEVPTDRIFLFSQAHYPKTKDSPGPGAYTTEELSKPRHLNCPGFLSSAKRDDKLSQKFFTQNFNPVGAGRYDIQKFEEAQDINGHQSVFKSKAGKPTLQMGKFLQERIRAKDICKEDRVFIQDPDKPRLHRSITIM